MPLQLENPELRDLMGAYFQGALGMFIDGSGDVVVPDTLIIDKDGVAVITLSNVNIVSTTPDILFSGNAVVAAEASLYLNIDSDNDSTNAALIIGKDTGTSGATELARVQENGNVGISNSSPNHLLSVGSDLGSQAGNRISVGNSSGPSALQIGEDSNNRTYLYWDDTGNTFQIGTVDASTNYSTMILKSGDVGIGGVFTPAGLLHIREGSGSGVAPNSSIKDLVVDTDGGNVGLSFMGTTSTVNNIAFGDSGSNIAGRIRYDHNDDSMKFYTNAIERVSIPNTGRVGINNASPAARLSVDQSSTTAATAVLELDQADLSEEFVDFVTTVGAGNPIDTAAIGTYYGKARIAVNGVFKYIALYNT